MEEWIALNKNAGRSVVTGLQSSQGPDEKDGYYAYMGMGLVGK